ncbi:MAG: acyl-CoA dehydrogenase family protein [Myxococcales bacterium]|nr:acyl-CoA dehydrogenase family protein [Myxococcales bacterium]
MQSEESRSSRLLSTVERVGALAKTHAQQSEDERTLAEPVVLAMRDSELLAMCVPRALGGLECDAATQLEAFERAARADGSFGWCLMIAALHNAMASAYLPEPGARELFGGARMPTIAGLVTPSGQARRVDGGFIVRGRWAFGSGIRHAAWVSATAIIEGTGADGAIPEFVAALVPKERVIVEDTWKVSGLRGTGSEHYRVEDAFVPEAHTYSWPMCAAERGGARYDLPLVALLATGHAGFALGTAEQSLDTLASLAPSRTRLWTQSPLAEHGSFLIELGKQRAKLTAARLLALDGVSNAERVVERGDALTTEDWARVRLAVTYATDVAAEVCTFAYRAAGSAGLFDTSPLQRCLRDILAATQHVAATDDAYEFSARVLLGTPLFNPLLLPRSPRSSAVNAR